MFGLTTTVNPALAPRPLVTLIASPYTPSALNRAVVVSALLFPNVIVPGPLVWIHDDWTGPNDEGVTADNCNVSLVLFRNTIGDAGFVMETNSGADQTSESLTCVR